MIGHRNCSRTRSRADVDRSKTSGPTAPPLAPPSGVPPTAPPLRHLQQAAADAAAADAAAADAAAAALAEARMAAALAMERFVSSHLGTRHATRVQVWAWTWMSDINLLDKAKGNAQTILNQRSLAI